MTARKEDIIQYTKTENNTLKPIAKKVDVSLYIPYETMCVYPKKDLLLFLRWWCGFKTRHIIW